MVAATRALSAVMTSTPRKLNAAAMRMADCGRMARVETHVAMALGASVQPLTRITPVVRMAVNKNGRLVNSSERNSCRVKVMACTSAA